MKAVVCFIDDSSFEHELVRDEIAPCAPELEFVQAYTFDESRSKLGPKTPGLFLLDLWGQDQEILRPHLTSQAELEEEISSFPTLDQTYEGLRDFRGDVNNEFLKRLFRIVDCWRALFEKVCDRIGQNRKYGLYNLAQVRAFYPGVPAVFYTRKSLISDAVAMFKAGADDLFIKPTGLNDKETRQLTKVYAPQLVADLKRLMEGPYI